MKRSKNYILFYTCLFFYSFACFGTTSNYQSQAQDVIPCIETKQPIIQVNCKRWEISTESDSEEIVDFLFHTNPLDINYLMIENYKFKLGSAVNLLDRLSNLKYLYLPGNSIKDEEIEKLIQIKSLITLNLENNEIGDTGAQSIATGLKSLTHLNLAHNQIGDAGVRCIIENLKDLTTLNLEENRLSDVGFSLLIVHLNEVEKLNL